MSKPISYTPPNVADPVPGAVARRHVFYLPGYDPEGRTRYRLLFVRELSRYAKRFGEPRREISRAEVSADGLVQSWTVAAACGGARVAYDVLLWDDIVMRDFARPRLASIGLLVLGTLHALAAGALFRFYRMNWKYGNVILYPFVMLSLLALATTAIAGLVHAHLGDTFGHSLGLPIWASIPLGILAAVIWVRAIEAFLNRIFFWQLLNDWVFNWQHGQGWRRDYDRRLDVFADYALARLAALTAPGMPAIDEVMIVGHSSGGLTAVELAARLIARSPRLGIDGPSLALVTLGSSLPLVAIQPRAGAVRAEIASLVTSRRIVWVDYGAPQDWMNFPGFNPSHELDLPLAPGAPIANPVLRSARFRDIIDEDTYRKVRARPFRMHFQFLMANDRPGAYDFFKMTLGPERLRERAFAHQPGVAPAPAASPPGG